MRKCSPGMASLTRLHRLRLSSSSECTMCSDIVDSGATDGIQHLMLTCPAFTELRVKYNTNK